MLLTGNVADFGPGGSRFIRHGLEHLSGADDWSSGSVALPVHHLLRDVDLGREEERFQMSVVRIRL